MAFALREVVYFSLGTNEQTTLWYDSFIFCILLCLQAAKNALLQSLPKIGRISVTAAGGKGFWLVHAYWFG